jgi:adenylosuccinate lyase
MRSERISSLSRFLISLLDNPYHVAANQWLERTLDDSAGRRIVIPEAFLAADSILNLYLSIVKGLTVNMNVVKANMREEISFMATENILMEAVKTGGDRQALHDKIRKHAMKSSRRMKETGKPSDLLKRIRRDKEFAGVMEEFDRFLDPKAFIGRSAEQVETYLREVVQPLVAERSDLLDEGAEEITI